MARDSYRIGGSVHVLIANEIGLRIVRGDYQPGTILPNEAAWAVNFKVSRSAVREAVKMLMAKNLLSSRPKIGSRVEPQERWNLFDRDILNWYSQGPDRRGFLRALQQLRYIIEPEAAALAAEHRSEEQWRLSVRHVRIWPMHNRCRNELRHTFDFIWAF